jgi:hypothetical protein
MVNEELLIKDKWKTAKKAIKFLIILLFIAFIILIAVGAGYFMKKSQQINKSENVQIVIENPLKNIVFSNTDKKTGEVNKQKAVEQAVFEFNEEYINYILAALGISYLHKSPLGENPKIKFVLGDETWSSEIVDGRPQTAKKETENEDLKISLSREEAVEAMLSKNIEEFMKSSVATGKTNIEMVAGKTELFMKGYLDMYEHITGEKII